jgi:hypothetical protein
MLFSNPIPPAQNHLEDAWEKGEGEHGSSVSSNSILNGQFAL